MSASKDIAASIVGSTACVYTGQPFDTVKVRMQVQPGEFKSSIACFQQTFKGEGLAALWKGSVPALTGALSENAMAFGVNGALRRFSVFNQDASQESKLFHRVKPFITGGITGMFTAVVLCPCDVIKCRAQLNRARGIESSLKDIIVSAWRTNGIRTLYTGFAAQVLRDIPFYAAFFGVYSVSCDVLKRNTNWSDPLVYFTSGG